ncbi:hypothetical protein MMC06_002365 [Schaereria dolodes]|nr:hypothetical protein [Schaereria dolodes]
MGVVVLPTVISLSRTLARLAIGLDKRPDLIAHLTRRESTLSNEETAERVTLVESSANVIREAFKKCLSERCGSASGLDLRGNPEGRRIGIYVCANLCLKLFFHCRKLRSAEQIFGNIYQQSPPLARFPTSQRVTYLYYLGRYHFANNHFFRAQASLQAAYNQCHAKCLKQRRSILIYLVASNIILGRFPSAQLFQRSEAKGISEKFLPICQAIKQGDLSNFSRLLDLDNDTATWFLQRRILLQLRNRCEVLVWRSLARKAFILSGFKGDTSKRAPSLDLIDLYSLGVFLEKQTLTLAAKQPTMSDTRSGPTHPNLLSIVPGPLSGKGDVDIGELVGYIDPDLVDEVEVDGPDLLSVEDIESITASLVEQDLLHGYISHRHLRFVITGSKLKPAIQAGFPNVWETIQNRAEKEVPGWVIEDQGNKAQNGLRQAGPGMVVNLSGARPVGVASS